MGSVEYLSIRKSRRTGRLLVSIPLLAGCALTAVAYFCHAGEEGSDIDPRISTEAVVARMALLEVDGDLPPARVEAILANLRWKILEPLDDASIGKIDRTQLLENLAAAVVDDDSIVSMHAAMGLVRLLDKGDRGIAEAMTTALRDRRQYVRGNAAAVLEYVGDGRSVEPLIGLVVDASAPVVANAVSALGEIGDIRATEPLVLLLGRLSQDPCGYDQWEGTHIVPRMPFIWLLDKNQEEQYRRAGMEPEYATTMFSTPLIKMLEAKDKDLCAYVRWHVADALRKITGKRFGQHFELWRMWWHQHGGKNSEATAGVRLDAKGSEEGTAVETSLEASNDPLSTRRASAQSQSSAKRASAGDATYLNETLSLSLKLPAGWKHLAEAAEADSTVIRFERATDEGSMYLTIRVVQMTEEKNFKQLLVTEVAAIESLDPTFSNELLLLGLENGGQALSSFYWKDGGKTRCWFVAPVGRSARSYFFHFEASTELVLKYGADWPEILRTLGFR